MSESIKESTMTTMKGYPTCLFFFPFRDVHDHAAPSWTCSAERESGSLPFTHILKHTRKHTQTHTHTHAHTHTLYCLIKYKTQTRMEPYLENNNLQWTTDSIEQAEHGQDRGDERGLSSLAMYTPTRTGTASCGRGSYNPESRPNCTFCISRAKYIG